MKNIYNILCLIIILLICGCIENGSRENAGKKVDVMGIPTDKYNTCVYLIDQGEVIQDQPLIQRATQQTVQRIDRQALQREIQRALQEGTQQAMASQKTIQADSVPLPRSWDCTQQVMTRKKAIQGVQTIQQVAQEAFQPAMQQTAQQFNREATERGVHEAEQRLIREGVREYEARHAIEASQESIQQAIKRAEQARGPSF